MKIALKEWAVVIQALACGQQLFLLRKGGIAEGKTGFELRHAEFLLFPTWEHQHAEAIRPEYQTVFQQVRPSSESAIEFRYCGQVTDVLRAPPSVDAMRQLSPYHLWAESHLCQRYEYRPDLPLYVVVLRTLRLPEAVGLPNDRHYRGCRSWVDLGTDVPIEKARPVLPAAEFQAKRQDLVRQLRAGAAR